MPAQDLINPPAFSDLSIDAMAFADRKNKPYMRQVREQLLVYLSFIFMSLSACLSDCLFLISVVGICVIGH